MLFLQELNIQKTIVYNIFSENRFFQIENYGGYEEVNHIYKKYMSFKVEELFNPNFNIAFAVEFRDLDKVLP